MSLLVVVNFHLVDLLVAFALDTATNSFPTFAAKLKHAINSVQVTKRRWNHVKVVKIVYKSCRSVKRKRKSNAIEFLWWFEMLEHVNAQHTK